MSRSYKKTPIIGCTLAESEKQNKKRSHRAFRRAEKNILHKMLNSLNFDYILPKYLEEVKNGDIWSWAKDGKIYVGNYIKKDTLFGKIAKKSLRK